MADPISTITLERSAPSVAGFERPGLSVKVEQGLGVAKLRIYGNDFDARFKSVVGFVPPAACRQVEKMGLTFAWMAPCEWVITGEEAAVAAWLAKIEAKGDEDLIAVDLTHARVTLVLEGAEARTVLASHCPLDLWDKNFPVDAVARSLLGDTGMFIARLADAGDAPRFRIIVDQTMAPYAARMLARG